MARASCRTFFGKCSGRLYWRNTESMSTPSSSGAPSTSMISPSGLCMARFPFAQFHHDFVADVRLRAPHRAAAAHKYHAECAGHPGSHKETGCSCCNVPTSCVRLRSKMRMTLPVGSADGALDASFWRHIAPHQHAVTIEGRGRGMFGNDNRRAAWDRPLPESPCLGD